MTLQRKLTVLGNNTEVARENLWRPTCIQTLMTFVKSQGNKIVEVLKLISLILCSLSLSRQLNDFMRLIK